MIMSHLKYLYFFPLLLISAISCGNNDLNPGGSGLIEATEVIISAETPGQVRAVFVGEGDNVVAGDTLIMVDTVNVRLRLRQAEALKNAAETQLEIAALSIKQTDVNLSLADKEFERIKTLIKGGSANQQQYDNAETAHQRAVLAREQASASRKSARADLQKIDAEIALLQKQLNDCYPVAPIAGIVSDKFIEAGELVNTGVSLLKISRLDTVWVKVYLPASDLTKIKPGDRAEIDPEDGRDKPLIGTVTTISPEAEFTPKNVQTREARANLVYAVKITIPNPELSLKIGMPVSVIIQ